MVIAIVIVVMMLRRVFKTTDQWTLKFPHSLLPEFPLITVITFRKSYPGPVALRYVALETTGKLLRLGTIHEIWV